MYMARTPLELYLVKKIGHKAKKDVRNKKLGVTVLEKDCLVL